MRLSVLCSEEIRSCEEKRRKRTSMNGMAVEKKRESKKMRKYTSKIKAVKKRKLLKKRKKVHKEV